MLTAAVEDRFGNRIEESRGYAWGSVLDSPSSEVRRMLHGRELVRNRARNDGDDSLHNLTGVSRDFPITSDDLEALRTQLRFYSHLGGKAEPLGIQYVSGDSANHDAVFVTRVTAGMLAVMLTLLNRDGRVLSLVPKGRSHPSVSNAVEVVGGEFREAVGYDFGLQGIAEGSPSVVVITTITPQKYHFSEAETRELIRAAKASGAIVVLDDAHAAARTGHFHQQPALALGEVDVVLCSMDKHLHGPRAGLVAGRRQIIEGIRAKIFEFGLEASFSSYAASLRSIQGYDEDEIRAASALSNDVRSRLRKVFGDDALYAAGAGVAASADDLTQIVEERAGGSTVSLVPAEISSIVAMRLVETEGLVTILAIGMPGASSALRLMMFPDGHNVGAKVIAEAVDESISFAAERANERAFVRSYILGD